jgi:hypothetical protein
MTSLPLSLREKLNPGRPGISVLDSASGRHRAGRDQSVGWARMQSQIRLLPWPTVGCRQPALHSRLSTAAESRRSTSPEP